MRLPRLLTAAGAATALALAAATAATAAPGDIERLTVDSGGGDPADGIVLGSLSLSDDGGLVAFESVALDLVDLIPPDADGSYDVFVRPLPGGPTSLQNRNSSGFRADGVFSGDPALSGDGTRLAFYSNALNMDGDSNDDEDIFRRLMPNGPTTERVTVDSVDTNAGSGHPDMTEDGASVVFDSTVPNFLVSDANAASDVFRWDGGSIFIISSKDGMNDAQGDFASRNPAISSDGTAVAFESDATDLDPTDTDDTDLGSADVFIREGLATERMSVPSGGGQTDGFSGNPDISGDGNEVVFASSDVLAPGGSPNGRGVYVRDRQAGTTERVDVPWGLQGAGNQEVQFDTPTISLDGRYVAFASSDQGLVPNDGNGAATDVFVRDRLEDRTIRVSVPAAGGQTTRRSLSGTISGDGSVVAFASEDNSLVPGDTTDPFVNGFFEAFAVEVEWVRPVTTITAAPPATTSSAQPEMSFAGNEPGSTFQCRVDGGAYGICQSPFVPPALAPGEHRLEVRAVDRFGNYDDSAEGANVVVGSAQEPEPEYRESFNAEPVSGTVFVTLPDGTRVRLEDLTNIPDGSVIDARNGKVRLFVEQKNGEERSAVFYAGVFRVDQLKNNITQLTLVGPLRASTSAAVAAAVEGRASARRRRLWGNGRGRFRSKGKYSSATVRGTKWLVEDRKRSTLTVVKQGSVKVRDFVKKKTVVVKKGKRYVAKKKRRRKR